MPHGEESHPELPLIERRVKRPVSFWVVDHQPDDVVMESTGIDWKSPYAALEKASIAARVVNARHVKNVPGRKTDIQDAQWLAMLARSGLLNGSFIPPEPLRQARLISRQRQKLVDQRSAEKNRLHKLLCDAGIRLSVVISDLNGRSGRKMVRGLIQGESIDQLLGYADKRLKAHIDFLDEQVTAFDQQLVRQLADYRPALELLTTLPGVDVTEIRSLSCLTGEGNRLLITLSTGRGWYFIAEWRVIFHSKLLWIPIMRQVLNILICVERMEFKDHILTF